MNLKDFSLLKEDDSSYTIGHPKGKSMQISKRGLSDKAQKLVSQLRREQHFNEGTPDGTDEEEETPAPTPKQDDYDYAKEKLSGLGQQFAQVFTGNPEVQQKGYERQAAMLPKTLEEENEPAKKVTEDAELKAAAQPVNPSDNSQEQMLGQLPVASPVASSAFSLEQQQKDLQSAVLAQKRAGEETARARREEAQALSQQKTADQIFQDYKPKDQALMQAANDQKIDPDRWYNNQSTGSKIASSIGLVLSGIGAGLTGGPNLAQQNMNRAIDADIDAQKNDQSKSMNLWKMNREMLGSDIQATLAAQNQMTLTAMAKVQAAAAGQLGAQAQANATPLMASLQQQIDTRNWMRSRLAGGQAGTEQQHLGEMEVMGKLNPAAHKEMESKYIPGMGTTRIPVTAPDRDKLTEFGAIANELQRAEHFQRTEAGSLGTFKGSKANAEAENIRNSLIVQMNKMYGLKRLTDVEYHNFMQQVPDVGSFRSGKALAQIENLKSQLDNQKSSVLKGLGFVPFKQAPDDAKYVAWAQQELKNNPGNIQAQQIMALNAPQQQPIQNPNPMVASNGRK